MFDVTVSEAVREAHNRSSASNVVEGGNSRENASNKVVKDKEQASEISPPGMSKQEIFIREKLQEYKPLAKVEELVEENYNQIDNQLSNTSPGENATEKRKKEIRKNHVEHKASDKRCSMKKRLLERQKQVAQQAPPKEPKTKHKIREL